MNRLARIKILATDWEKGDGWMVVPLVVTLAGLADDCDRRSLDAIGGVGRIRHLGVKAKVLAHEALRPTPACFHDLTLSYSHLDYR